MHSNKKRYGRHSLPNIPCGTVKDVQGRPDTCGIRNPIDIEKKNRGSILL
jgi:hypothetical protein